MMALDYMIQLADKDQDDKVNPFCVLSLNRLSLKQLTFCFLSSEEVFARGCQGDSLITSH